MSTTDTIDRFFDAWNAEDDDRRRRAVQAAWTDDGVVTDPLLDVAGHEAIAAAIAAARAQFPGHRFRPASGVDAHHDVVRFAWQLVGPDGQAVAEGYETGRVAADGRLACTYGFFGPLPATEEEVAA